MLVLVRNAYHRLRDRFRGPLRLGISPPALTVTEFERGPFCVVITDPAWPEDPGFPIVVSPPMGYESKAAAVAYAMQFVGRRPGRSYRFAIAQCKSEAQFRVFCSWDA